MPTSSPEFDDLSPRRRDALPQRSDGQSRAVLGCNAPCPPAPTGQRRLARCRTAVPCFPDDPCSPMCAGNKRPTSRHATTGESMNPGVLCVVPGHSVDVHDRAFRRVIRFPAQPVMDPPVGGRHLDRIAAHAGSSGPGCGQHHREIVEGWRPPTSHFAPRPVAAWGGTAKHPRVPRPDRARTTAGPT